MEPTLSLEPGLTGRDEELALLCSLASNATSHGAVIAGEMGVGKSRLAEEALHHIAGLGWPVVRIRATHSASTVPFGAFAALLPDDPPLGSTQLDTFRRVARAVADPSAGGRVVVLIDDAHHLDDASAAVVGHLATGPAFVIVTLRSGAATPDVITALWKDGIAARIDLQTLSQAETTRLVESMLGGPVEEPTARRIWGWTNGNPLYVREVVLAGRNGGELVGRTGLWCWHGGMPVNARLLELVAARLSDLPASVTALLELVSVGEPLEPRLLGPHRPALELAESLGLVTMVDGRRDLVRLAHPLYGEVLRARLDGERATALYLDLAQRLEAIGVQRRGDVLRLATWFLRAGRTPTDPALLISASRQALAAGDHGMASRLALAAGDAGAGHEAVLARAESAYWAGHFDDVLEALATVDWGSEPGPLAATAAILGSSAVFWGRGDPSVADRLLIDAEHDLAGDASRHEVVAHHASLAFFSARAEHTLELGGAVFAAAEAGPLARLPRRSRHRRGAGGAGGVGGGPASLRRNHAGGPRPPRRPARGGRRAGAGLVPRRDPRRRARPGRSAGRLRVRRRGGGGQQRVRADVGADARPGRARPRARCRRHDAGCARRSSDSRSMIRRRCCPGPTRWPARSKRSAARYQLLVMRSGVRAPPGSLR